MKDMDQEVIMKKTSRRRSSRRVSFAEKEQIKVFEKDWSDDQRHPLQELSRNGLSNLISAGFSQQIEGGLMEECSIEEAKQGNEEPLVFQFETENSHKKGRPSDMDLTICEQPVTPETYNKPPPQKRLSTMDMCSIDGDSPERREDNTMIPEQYDDNTNPLHLASLGLCMRTAMSPKSILKHSGHPSPDRPSAKELDALLENDYVCSTPSFMNRDSDSDQSESMELTECVGTLVIPNSTHADYQKRMNETTNHPYPQEPYPDRSPQISKMELSKHNLENVLLSSTRVDQVTTLHEHTSFVNNITTDDSFCKAGDMPAFSKSNLSLVPSSALKMPSPAPTNLSSLCRKQKPETDDYPFSKRQCMGPIISDDNTSTAINYVSNAQINNIGMNEKSILFNMKDTQRDSDQVNMNQSTCWPLADHSKTGNISNIDVPYTSSDFLGESLVKKSINQSNVDTQTSFLSKPPDVNQNTPWPLTDYSKEEHLSDIDLPQTFSDYPGKSMNQSAAVDTYTAFQIKKSNVSLNKPWSLADNSGHENISDIDVPCISNEISTNLIEEDISTGLVDSQATLQPSNGFSEHQQTPAKSLGYAQGCDQQLDSPETPVPAVRMLHQTTPIVKLYDVITPSIKRKKTTKIKSQINEVLTSTPVWCISSKSNADQAHVEQYNPEESAKDPQSTDLKIQQDRVLSILKKAVQQKLELEHHSSPGVLSSPANTSISINQTASEEIKDENRTHDQDNLLEDKLSLEKILEAELKQKTRSQSWSVMMCDKSTVILNLCEGKINITCDRTQEQNNPHVIKSCRVETVPARISFFGRKVVHVLITAMETVITNSLTQTNVNDLPMLIDQLSDTIASYRPMLKDLSSVFFNKLTFHDHSRFSLRFVNANSMTDFDLCGEILDSAKSSPIPKPSVQLSYQHRCGNNMSSEVDEIIARYSNNERPVISTVSAINRLFLLLPE